MIAAFTVVLTCDAALLLDFSMIYTHIVENDLEKSEERAIINMTTVEEPTLAFFRT